MLQYSFVAEPNSPVNHKDKMFGRSFASNPLSEENIDFKSSFRSSIMDEDPDPDQDLRNDCAEFERDEEVMLSV